MSEIMKKIVCVAKPHFIVIDHNSVLEKLKKRNRLYGFLSKN